MSEKEKVIVPLNQDMLQSAELRYYIGDYSSLRTLLP